MLYCESDAHYGEVNELRGNDDVEEDVGEAEAERATCTVRPQ